MASLGAHDLRDMSSASSSQSRHRSESVSSHSHDPNGTSGSNSSLMPPDQTRPRSSSSSKALLTMALLEAQSAVQLDNANDITAALDAYRRAVTLLGKVMDASSSAEEQERLRTIHDSYLFRIHLLSTPPAPPSTSATDFGKQMLSTPPAPAPSLPSHPVAEMAAQISPARPPAHQQQQQQQANILSAPQHPPPQQPLPPPPRQSDPSRASGSSNVSSITPASSSNALSSQGGELEMVAQGVVPPPRRTKKHVPVPLQSSSLTSSNIQPPSEPRTPRQRSDSTSAGEYGSPGHTRHHTRSHTGGSIHRVTGDLISAAEQLQIQAQQHLPGVPKVRSRDQLGVPIHSAPTAPLPPTPTALGPLPCTPPPVPVPGSGSAASTPTHSNPSTPGLSSTPIFSTSLPLLPSTPPPKAPLPQIPTNLVSPPASPAHATRRISPLVPSSGTPSGQTQQQQQQQQHPQLQLQSQHHSGHGASSQYSSSPLQKSFMSPPECSPENNPTSTEHGRFYGDEPVSDEWLPNLSSKAYSNSQEHVSEDPYPRERVTSKGSYTATQIEQFRSRTTNATDSSHHAQLQQQQQSSSPHHQRSASQSSTISTHHLPIAQSSRSPLSGPMYNFQGGASSISSLHALDNPSSYKRVSDSARSLKEGSPLTRSSASSGITSGAGTVGSPFPLSSSPVQQQIRPTMLQHQSSNSKLSNKSTSPTLDKSWSPSLNSSHGQPTSTGGMTLFDVISEDPFGGVSFPIPPPFVDAAPADPYFRCFWLMHKLEQTMLTGGFLSKRLYVPRTIWYQSAVRLPAADSKISACQALSAALGRITTQSRNRALNLLVEAGGGQEGDVERMTILKELESLEAVAHQVQAKLSKKLSFIHRPGKNGAAPLTIATNQGYQEDQQGPLTGGNASVYNLASYDWSASTEEPMPGSSLTHEKSIKKVASNSEAGSGGLKSQWKSFSKSVQKSIANDRVEDTSSYTEAVVRLFQASYVLETMLRHYSALSPFQTHIQIVNRLRRLCDVLHQVICAFVVRDLGELMGKYVKRVGSWVAE